MTIDEQSSSILNLIPYICTSYFTEVYNCFHTKFINNCLPKLVLNFVGFLQGKTFLKEMPYVIG